MAWYDCLLRCHRHRHSLYRGRVRTEIEVRLDYVGLNASQRCKVERNGQIEGTKRLTQKRALSPRYIQALLY